MTTDLNADRRITPAQLAAIAEHLDTRLAAITHTLSAASIQSRLPGHLGFARAKLDALSLEPKSGSRR